MWYFTWILGVLLASAFGIINVMWLELEGGLDDDDGPPAASDTPGQE
ncbi:MAG TPA: cytochrome bd-I oxidase subunit CydX [Thiolinea sp.]|nr:cytochrome bd-I oxidase subunit CydX [Thiolinea sp.]